MLLATTWVIGFWLAAPASGSVEIDRVDGRTVHFRVSEGEKPLPPLSTFLQAPRPLGLLRPSDGLPYVLLADDRAVHLIRADGGRRMEFVFPGRIVDPKTGHKLLESSAYFGRCLKEEGEVYVVYQTEVIDRRRNKKKVKTTEPSVFIARPERDLVHERLTELRSLASLQSRKRETLRKVKDKLCFEVEGRNRPLSKEVVSLRTKRDLSEEDDDTLPREDSEPASDRPQAE